MGRADRPSLDEAPRKCEAERRDNDVPATLSTRDPHPPTGPGRDHRRTISMTADSHVLALCRGSLR
jgi:hypothetical protein